jgi:hypothetical protein
MINIYVKHMKNEVRSNTQSQKPKASVLAVSVVMLGIIMVIALSVSMVALQERKSSSGANKSINAYQLADSGAEKVLQLIKDNGTGNMADIVATGVTCSNGKITTNDGWSAELKKEDGSLANCSSTKVEDIRTIKSIGTADNQSQRAIEVAVAADSSCGSVPTEIDSSDRGPATVVAAAEFCRNMGSCWHLPNLEEMSVFMDPDASSSKLWTTTVGSTYTYRTTLNLKSGAWEDSANANSELFRCVR